MNAPESHQNFPQESGRSRDSVYAAPREKIGDFVFDETVADVFPDMIQRSVPGYDAITSLIGVLASRYAQPNSTCYDLGCSLGAATLSMRRRLHQPGCHIVAVDNSEAMIRRCRQNIDADASAPPVDILCADILDVKIRNASVVVLNFILQFIHPEQRLQALSNIYQGLLPGGILILSEKIRFSDLKQQTFHTEMHYAFKKDNGYSDLEISQKRAALEKVLIPETLTEHRERLLAAGFARCDVWFQCLNFASLFARK
jgi:tRNA (cmo5U34)-methyltransferase